MYSSQMTGHSGEKTGQWIDTEPQIGIAPWWTTWVTDDNPIPWPSLPEVDRVIGLRRATLSSVMTGISQYNTPTSDLPYHKRQAALIKIAMGKEQPKWLFRSGTDSTLKTQ